MLPSRLQDDAAELQRYFQVSPKLLGFGEACFGVLESVMLWRGIMGFTKFGGKRVNDLDLLSGYVVGVACLHRENPCRRICMQLAPRTSWSSVLYLSFLLAMLCSSSFCCIFICTNPKQTLLMSVRSSFHWGMSTFLVTPSVCCVFICTNSRHTLKTSLCCAFYWRKPCHDHTFDLLCFHMYKPQSNLNSRQRTKPTVAARKKKKLIELSFKILSHLLASSGPIDLRFEQGLLEVCTYEKPACQSFATWSVPAIVKCPMGRVFRVCSRFVHMKTQHVRVLAASVLFVSLFRAGWCLLMLPEALAQTSMFEREWQIHVSHRQIAIQQLLRQ